MRVVYLAARGGRVDKIHKIDRHDAGWGTKERGNGKGIVNEATVRSKQEREGHINGRR